MPEERGRYIQPTFHKRMTRDGLKKSFEYNLKCTLAKDQYTATMNDKYLALSIAIRDRIVERWMATQQRYHKENLKHPYLYLCCGELN